MTRWIWLALLVLAPLGCDTTGPSDAGSTPPRGTPPGEPLPESEPEPTPQPAGPVHFVSVAWSDARGEAVFSGYDGIATFDPASGVARTVTTEDAGGGPVRVATDGTAAYVVAARPGEDPNRDPSHLWRIDLATGERALVLEFVHSALLARDANVAAVTRSRRGPGPDSLLALDLATGETRYLRDGYPAALSPDGRQVLVRPRFESGFALVEMQSGTQIATVQDPGAFVTSIQWGANGPVAFKHTSTPDGSAHDGTAVEVDLLTGAEIPLWEGRGFVQSVYGWSPREHLALFTTFVCQPTPFGECVFGSTTRRVATDGEDRTFGERILGPTLLTPDGEWLVATRHSDTEGDVPVAYRVRDLD